MSTAMARRLVIFSSFTTIPEYPCTVFRDGPPDDIIVGEYPLGGDRYFDYWMAIVYQPSTDKVFKFRWAGQKGDREYRLFPHGPLPNHVILPRKV
jgi:hypothetical protein